MLSASRRTLLALHASVLCPCDTRPDSVTTHDTMTTRPSPSSTSPSILSNSPFPHGSHSSSTSSSPPKLFASHNTMTADAFASPMYPAPGAIGERRPVDKAPTRHSILLRKLPSNSDREAVRNILLFAKDLIDCELIPQPRHADDKGFASAIAHFQTFEGAKEARDLLNGKRNATNDATLVVELMHEAPPPGAVGSRRNTLDSIPARQASVVSTMSTSTTNGRQSSRYNGTFQNMEKMSPPNGTPGLGNGEFPVNNLFSPTSPVNTSFASRNLGKSVINDEADDDDGLLNESIGYATGGPQAQSSMQRRATNPNSSTIPVQRFGSLSLNTNGAAGVKSPPMSNYASPRSGSNMQSPGPSLSAMSPHSIPSALSSGPSTGYQQYSQHFARPTYPPVNPADQNPPCKLETQLDNTQTSGDSQHLQCRIYNPAT